jgi:cell division protein FtsB
MSSNQLSSDQLILHHFDSNSVYLNASKHDQSQLDQQIEQNIDETQSVKEINQKNQMNVFLHETNTIDLSTSSQKLDELFNKKRKTKEER